MVDKKSLLRSMENVKEIFLARFLKLLKAADHSSDLDEFNEPNCYISSNRKASVKFIYHINKCC